ncbi:hypothetical protein PVK06_033751 [Gossypium arboreum]|uniref:Uncharacterized protein n=1 Tax=Gossypium arboreum TaxID=29729 RepID=A0ABR0ND92_GOSAR|nr:hypothetical protein PVK06_033751 [Gossypium arboreum]
MVGNYEAGKDKEASFLVSDNWPQIYNQENRKPLLCRRSNTLLILVVSSEPILLIVKNKILREPLLFSPILLLMMLLFPLVHHTLKPKALVDLPARGLQRTTFYIFTTVYIKKFKKSKGGKWDLNKLGKKGSLLLCNGDNTLQYTIPQC